ncbi:MAG TPA: sulfurtransferase [Polyangiaceae bacterium]|jgi:thiosulfate/3-mercaptopyruvate sulfurtransferase|nr:sulfurtransferase [Polyangiaceae bacterium]
MGGAGGVRHEILVSTEWLAAQLGDPGLRVIDIRGVVRPPGTTPRYAPKRDDFDREHIPGALFVDWTRDIVDPHDPVPVQVAPPDAFARTMAALGVGDATLVVAYDDYDHIFAGRLAWALRYYGHDAVRILDGGFIRWKAEGRPTTDATVTPAAAHFTAHPRPALRRTADEVAHALGRTDVLLVDARAPEQYAGTVSAAARSGHIPGARNIPYAQLIDQATGLFRPPADLRRAFADAGIDVERLPAEVVVYCNGGISCTVPLEALRLLGRSDVAVYDGSWNEWGNDTTRPITQGAEP